MSFLIPLARAAATVAGKGRLTAFMIGKGMSSGGDKQEAPAPSANQSTTTPAGQTYG